jgi:hypothetical protein
MKHTAANGVAVGFEHVAGANAGGRGKRDVERGDGEADTVYVDPMLLDLSTTLPLPPTQDSEMTKQELAYVHKIEQTRIPQQVVQAQQDDKEESPFVFTNVIGPQVTRL